MASVGEQLTDRGPLPELAAIWAQTGGGVIGREGNMPWYAPEDLAHFKRLTLGAPVVMGRVTWESFPAAFRPLPGRLNIVLTSSVASPSFEQGAWWVPSLERALDLAAQQAPQAQTIWVIGGGSLYAQALEAKDLPQVAGGRLSRVERTLFDLELAGDTVAPQLGDDWALVSESQLLVSERGYGLGTEGQRLPLAMRFQTLRRG